MRPAYLSLALAMLLLPTASIVGGYSLAGPGATTCGEIADEYRLNPELTDAAMVLWTEGFMRGVNEEGQDLTIDSKEQADRLRAYCDLHPLASFEQAARNLYDSLQPWVDEHTQ